MYAPYGQHMRHKYMPMHVSIAREAILAFSGHLQNKYMDINEMKSSGDFQEGNLVELS
jgi:hypothetical protein